MISEPVCVNAICGKGPGDPLGQTIRWLLLMLGGILLGGCWLQTASMETGLSDLPFHPEVFHYVGSPLAGPLNDIVKASDMDPNNAYEVVVTWAVVDKSLHDQLDPIEQYAQMIITLPDKTPVVSISGMGKTTRGAHLNDPKQFLQELIKDETSKARVLESVQGALLPGVTATFLIQEEESIMGGQAPQIEIRVCREHADRGSTKPSQESVNMAVVQSGLRVLASDEELSDQSESMKTAQSRFLTDVIVLAPHPIKGDDTFAMSFVCPFNNTWAETLLAFVTIRPVHRSPTFESTVQHCLANVSQPPEKQDSLLWTVDGATSEPTKLVLRLDMPYVWQKTLVCLATTYPTRLAQDLALCAPPDIARRLAREVFLDYFEGTPSESADLAWSLEINAYELMINELSQETLNPEILATLILHTGQIAMDVATLREVITRSHNLDELEENLVQENKIFLEDISPAARTRAFEWLAARNKAPQGFDPLATTKERRAALAETTDSLN